MGQQALRRILLVSHCHASGRKCSVATLWLLTVGLLQPIKIGASCKQYLWHSEWDVFQGQAAHKYRLLHSFPWNNIICWLLFTNNPFDGYLLRLLLVSDAASQLPSQYPTPHSFSTSTTTPKSSAATAALRQDMSICGPGRPEHA